MTDKIIDEIKRIRLVEKYTFPAEWELKWLARTLSEVRQGDIIVDIGAYIGIYSIAFAKSTGDTGKVYAFEPNPNNIKAIKKNLKLNDISSLVEISNIAIGDKQGTVSLSKEDSISHVLLQNSLDVADIQKVEVKTLDEIFYDKKIDIIKVDTEGYEGQILKGGQELLKKKDAPKFIFIEIHPYMWRRYGTCSEDILGMLQACDYNIEIPKLKTKLDDAEHHWVIFATKCIKK